MWTILISTSSPSQNTLLIHMNNVYNDLLSYTFVAKFYFWSTIQYNIDDNIYLFHYSSHFLLSIKFNV